MTTREAVNQFLKIVGSHGLDGRVVLAVSTQAGVEKLLRRHRGANSGRVLAEIRRQGLVDVSSENGRVFFRPTPAGLYRLQNLTIDELTIPKPKKWDKKWRLVSFDVPISHTKNRAAFVERLQLLGFTMLQKSLWVYPLPCFDQVEKVASHYNVLRYCTLMEVSKVDQLTARRLHRHFSRLIS